MSECKTYMTRADILDAIHSLSQSQGFYSCLYDSLNKLAENDPVQYDLYMEHLQQQNFQDPVDLVLFFEC